MKNKIVLVLGLVLFIHAGLNATSTMYCQCKKKGILVRLHINSYNEIADITIFLDDKEYYTYDSEELSIAKLVWKSYDNPGNGNRLEAVRIGEKGAGQGDKPNFKLTVKGAKGILLLKGKHYPITCDWRR
ncbi:MAG: hypothetical protein GY757_58945 [bacterium]|nr:hypothetical protein [bacterium]